MASDPHNVDLQALLSLLQQHAQSPEHFTSFERDFPNVCFALATGVGKTRLMGACIAYLHAAYGIRHFMVLAPNLTIYNKLIADFSEGSASPKLDDAHHAPSKYVFKGLAQYATAKPIIVTGDNYESGVGANDGHWIDRIFINIFNISKFNSKEGRKFHKLSECIGESYFEYLSGLDNLVLLMDEAHRYRASSAMKMIDELKPRLGIEMTATPQIEKGSTTTVFKNIAYQYVLADAMRDGYVKEPEVATRENFKKERYNEQSLERLKLEDGIRIHNQKKVDLELYAREQSLPLVKPFMLVVAKDIEHASQLVALLESDAFCGGDYTGKVLQVDSKSKGKSKNESEDIVEKLLTVENPNNPIEIVVHVNMLKEGWDVTNLYTIVPLRAANSKTLVEQSIGRGLRLPYGRRTGVTEVDTLTIVSHDKFEDIVQEAQNADCIMRKRYLPEDGIEEVGEVIIEPSSIEQSLGIASAYDTSGAATATATETTNPSSPPTTKPIYSTPHEQAAAAAVLETAKSFASQVGSLKELSQVKKDIAAQASTVYNANRQTTIGEVMPQVDMNSITEQVLEEIQKRSIEIPKVMVVPEGQETGYNDFDLIPPSTRPQAIDDERMHIRSLQDTSKKRILESDFQALAESRLEDYILNKLIDFDDIDYDQHNALINKLATQMVEHVRSYLDDDIAIEKVLRQNAREFAQLIHAQMEDAYYERAASYRVIIKPNVNILEATAHSSPAGQDPFSFRSNEYDKGKIGRYVFNGFNKCIYNTQKFQSDTERTFAVILEDDAQVQTWVKPTKKHIEIDYKHAGRTHSYWPDFIVEADDAYYLCEPKSSKQIHAEDTQEKSRAAVIWCQHASTHNADNGLKPWRYLLIPHNEITISATLSGLAALFTVS